MLRQKAVRKQPKIKQPKRKHSFINSMTAYDKWDRDREDRLEELAKAFLTQPHQIPSAKEIC